jgi:hypothetical protein
MITIQLYGNIGILASGELVSVKGVSPGFHDALAVAEEACTDET